MAPSHEETQALHSLFSSLLKATVWSWFQHQPQGYREANIPQCGRKLSAGDTRRFLGVVALCITIQLPRVEALMNIFLPTSLCCLDAQSPGIGGLPLSGFPVLVLPCQAS